ncbi:MAG: hypothetical protein PHX80_04660 [Candidatus Nanoarchaeia archaeon]|nr:hypothetical protein [Candidatus Nanoarchaeia archaeon]
MATKIDQKELIKYIISILGRAQLPVNNEKELQVEIAKIFDSNPILYRKEYWLDANHVIDFFIPSKENKLYGIGMEVKIKGNARQIYKQCQKYCLFTAVESFILVTNRAIGFPAQINNKPCYVLNLGKAWL